MDKRVWLEKNGVEIDLDGDVNWSFTRGGQPSEQPLTVSSVVDEQLINAGALGGGYGPWKLNFNGEATISQIYFVQRQGAVGFDRVRWIMSDVRWPLKGLMVDCYVNRMRQVDDFDRPDPASIGQDVSLFTQVPKRQFMPSFCRKSSTLIDPQFQTKPAGVDVDYEPWTALSFLIYLMRDDGYIARYSPLGGFNAGTAFSFVGGGPIIDTRVAERKIILPPGYNPNTHWRSAVDELARMARVVVYPDENGQFVITSASVEASAGLGPGYGYYDGSGRGVVTTIGYENIAPRALRIHFPEWVEIRWDYDEVTAEEMAGLTFSNFPFLGTARAKLPTATDYLGNKSFLLQNVVKVPQDTKNFRKGQWGEIFTVLDDWGHDLSAYKTRRGILGTPDKLFNIQVLRACVLTQALGIAWQRDIDNLDFRDPILEARVAAAYTYYRSYFKIPDFWMDYIRSMRATTAEIFSTTSRVRQPSPLYIDYHAWDTAVARMKGGTVSTMNAQTGARGEGYLRNIPVDNFADGWISKAQADSKNAIKRITELTLDEMTPAPGEVFIQDAELGVIGYALNPDLGNLTIDRSVGLAFVNSKLTAGPLGLSARIRTAFRQSGLINAIGQLATTPHFRFSTILSCLWLTPNSPRRYYVIRKDGGGFITGASGPSEDLMYSSFDAVKAYRDGQVTHTEDPQAGVILLHGGPVANEELLKEVAEAKAANHYYDYIPRVIGSFRAVGWTGQKPIGNVHETAIKFSEGFLETELGFSESTPSLSIWELLPPDVRNILQRLPRDTE